MWAPIDTILAPRVGGYFEKKYIEWLATLKKKKKYSVGGNYSFKVDKSFSHLFHFLQMAETWPINRKQFLFFYVTGSVEKKIERRLFERGTLYFFH